MNAQDTPRTAPPPGPDHPRLLPSTLIEEEPPGGGRRVRRTLRDWLVDLAMFVLAALFGLMVASDPATRESVSPELLLADQIAGAAACAALWLRRRWPVGLAVALTPLGTFSDMAGGPQVVALFTVAVHRPLPVTAAVVGANLVTVPVYAAVRPTPDMPFAVLLVLGLAITLAATGWGMFVRARRQLVFSLRERARRAESEAQLRAERAQREAREQIAREMHDVLAHRLSLLSVHAGALEYRPGAPPEEVARAAGVIRDSAHQALQDLREVIGVLRAPVGRAAGDGGEGWAEERPQPTLAALPRLVEESVRAGARITLRDRLPDPAGVPDAVGRSAYRIVQEALTNARKHAPGAATTVTVAGGPGDGLTVEVRNPLPEAGARGAAIPGAGQGLIGLAERAALAGGRIEHGPTACGHFRVYAWLPWPA
ncbi:histidine kinase [Streptomyces capparidis]